MSGSRDGTFSFGEMSEPACPAKVCSHSPLLQALSLTCLVSYPITLVRGKTVAFSPTAERQDLKQL